MDDDTVFAVDRERKTLRLNERYRSQLEGADGSDSTIKALVFLLVSEEFGRTRVRAAHDDAIDRLLVATALAEGLSLLTSDEEIRKYPVSTIW